MEIPTITIEDDNYIYNENGTVYSKYYKRFIGVYDNGYLQTTIGGQTKYIHRLIYEKFIGEIPEGLEIDHINHVRDDNRVINLSVKTPGANCQRKLIGKRNTSGFIGVSFRKDRNYWQARINNNGKCIFNQSGFKTAEEANDARNNFLDTNPELCKDFARN